MTTVITIRKTTYSIFGIPFLVLNKKVELIDNRNHKYSAKG